MIVDSHQQTPQLSIRHLCDLFGINRAWYYVAQQPDDPAVLEAETALRAAIEQIVVEFPRYG